MEIVMIGNLKGGIGKTSFTLALANALTALGFRVLAVDFDPTGNLSASALPVEAKWYLYDVFKQQCNVRDAICHTEICDVLPTSWDIDLNREKSEMLPVNVNSRSLGTLADNWSGRRGVEWMLASLLRKSGSGIENDYDFVLIDTAPYDNILTTNAIIAADSVIIPCEPSLSSLDGVLKILNSILDAQVYCRSVPRTDGIVLTKYSDRGEDYRTSTAKIQSIAEQRHLDIYGTKMRVSLLVPKAASNYRPILDYITLGVAAIDALNLGLEFLARRGLQPKKDYPGVVRNSGGIYSYTGEAKEDAGK